MPGSVPVEWSQGFRGRARHGWAPVPSTLEGREQTMRKGRPMRGPSGLARSLLAGLLVLAACSEGDAGDAADLGEASSSVPVASGGPAGGLPGEDGGVGDGSGCSVAISGDFGAVSWTAVERPFAGVSIYHDGDVNPITGGPTDPGPLFKLACRDPANPTLAVGVGYHGRTDTDDIVMEPRRYEITAHSVHGGRGSYAALVTLGPSSRIGTHTPGIRSHVPVGTVEVEEWTEHRFAGRASFDIFDLRDPSVRGKVELTFDFRGDAIQPTGTPG